MEYKMPKKCNIKCANINLKCTENKNFLNLGNSLLFEKKIFK